MIDNYITTIKQPGLKNLLADYMPNERAVNAFLTNAMRLKSSNPMLAKCSPKSINSCLLSIAEYGLSLSMGEVYLIPYGADLSLQLGYKGLVTLAYQSGDVKAIHCETVHEGDDFQISHGTNSSLVHTPNFDTVKNSSNMKAVYAICELNSGGKIMKVMSKLEIDEHRSKYSKSRGRSSPWDTSYLAMAQKTALKQVLKTCPKSMRHAESFPEGHTYESEVIEVKPVEENLLELPEQKD